MQVTEVQKTPQKISEVMNELSLYIVFALGFMIFKYISEVLFNFLSTLLFPLFYEATQPAIKSDGSSKSDEKKSSLDNYFREHGFLQLTGAVHAYNTYIRGKGLGKSESPYTILEEMKEQDIAPDIATYNTLIYLCFKENKEDFAFELFHQCCHPDFEVAPDIITFNTYIKGLILVHDKRAKKVSLECIPKIFEEIERFKLKANDITYNTVIDLCITLGGIKEAWNCFLSMHSKGIEPDLFTYSILVKGLKEQPHIYQENFDFLYQSIETYIKKNSDRLDEILFNSLIDTAVAYKDFDKVNRTLEYMRAYGIQFSNITYGILVKAFGQNGMIESALVIFEQMRKHNVQPNEITYGCVIDACVRAQMYDKAAQLLRQMNAEKIPANIVIYTTLLKGYTKQKDFNKAWELYEKIVKEREVAPNIIFYNAILEAMNQCHKPNLLMVVYNQILTEDPREVKPDIITYSTLIKGLCKTHQLDAVMQLYRKVCQEASVAFDEVLHNLIMHSLVAAERYADCEYIYSRMQEQGISPSEVTYSILTKLYTKTGQYQKAIDLYEAVQRTPRKMGVIFSTSVLQSCIKSRQIKKAIAVFEALRKDSKGELDQVVYNTIVSGCIYAGHLQHALDYVQCAMEDQIILAPNIYNSLVKNLLSSRTMEVKERKDRLKSVLEYLKFVNIKLDEELYGRTKRFIYNSWNRENKLKTGYYNSRTPYK